MDYKIIDELIDYVQPNEYIVKSENYNDSYSVPVLTPGKTFVLGYTNEDVGVYKASKDNPIILFDDFTTEYKWVDFDFKVKSSACKILKPKNSVNLRYVYYAMRFVDIDKKLHKRYWISNFSKQSIYYPDEEQQKMIVSVLDKIVFLKSDLIKTISKFETIVKSQFIEMFGDVFYNDNGYQLVKINDVVKYEQPTKYIVSSEDYNDSYQIPVLTAGKSFILGYTDENDGIFYGSKEKIVIFDDFTCDSKIVNFDFKVKSSAMKLLHMTKDINIDFFYHALKQNHYNVANHKRHWISVFEIMEMGLPPIEEQNKFADFVQQIDKSKFIVQKQIKLLEELLEKKMNEYFGD